MPFHSVDDGAGEIAIEDKPNVNNVKDEADEEEFGKIVVIEVNENALWPPYYKVESSLISIISSVVASVDWFVIYNSEVQDKVCCCDLLATPKK